MNKTSKYLKTTVYLAQCLKLPVETDALFVTLPHIWQQGCAVTYTGQVSAPRAMSQRADVQNFALS